MTALHTVDGVRLAARIRTPAAGWDGRLACVVAHGFTGSSAHARVQDICRVLAEITGALVVCPDFRGHGASGGASTVGELEIHDVAAAVAHARSLGAARVAVLGWSMGGSVVVRHAGLAGDADAVVSVSSPGHWFERGTRAMRVVHWVCETSSGRLACRLARRTRLVEAWHSVPASPVEVAAAIDVPYLVVHGYDDHYFPVHHARLLHAAAARSELWLEGGMGHAETATTPELTARIGRWLLAALGTGSSAVGQEGLGQ